MELPKIEEWESLNGWCHRLAKIYGMDSTQANVLEEVSRQSYIRGVNDILDAKNDKEAHQSKVKETIKVKRTVNGC